MAMSSHFLVIPWVSMPVPSSWTSWFVQASTSQSGSKLGHCAVVNCAVKCLDHICPTRATRHHLVLPQQKDRCPFRRYNDSRNNDDTGGVGWCERFNLGGVFENLNSTTLPTTTTTTTTTTQKKKHSACSLNIINITEYWTSKNWICVWD